MYAFYFHNMYIIKCKKKSSALHSKSLMNAECPLDWEQIFPRHTSYNLFFSLFVKLARHHQATPV